LSRNLLRQQILIVPTVVLVICTAGAFAAGACADEGSAWREAVAPILQQHCYRCHGPLKQESRVRLDTLSGDLLNDRAAAEMWHEVLNVLNTAEMPPADEPQLTATGQLRVVL
jgi:mono/diheme cytochrome c family protein